MHKSDFNEYFDRMFDTSNQGKFETWFSDLAACVWGNDFEVIKAGGRHGDKKSDGRRVSTETVFQCYAPESPATFAKKGSAKMNDSFPKVLEYWPNLKEWIFVHNNKGGIPAKVHNTLEDLRAEYPNITISIATRRFLKDELHDLLTLNQLLHVYPSASLNFRDVGMEHIRPLLKRIINEKTTEYDSSDFGEIPDEKKLKHNLLSPDAKHALIRARPNIGIVDRYINGMSNPNNASIIQAKMQAKYCELRDFGYDPF